MNENKVVPAFIAVSIIVLGGVLLADSIQTPGVQFAQSSLSGICIGLGLATLFSLIRD